jgi:arylsulfatase A
LLENELMKLLIPILFAALLVLNLTASLSAKERQPNVVLILVDDFGYECVGANGSTSYKTPELDKLASTGMRFQHCYAQPLCTPTRVQLMTGIYNVRNYSDFGQIDPNVVTFANLFQKAGYATAIAGKWQLGKQADLPAKLGFDEHCLWQHTRRPSRYKNPGLEIQGEEVDYLSGEYGPDVVNDWALSFIDRHQDRPFLLYYPMMLTHGPFEPTPDSDDYAGGKQEKAGRKNAAKENRKFAEMVTYADKLIGKVVQRLDQLKLRENTLVLIVGDNGTGAGVRSRVGNQVVDGGKGTLTRAGMHVPLIVNWPTRIDPAQVNDNLVDTSDFLPTMTEAARVEVPSALAIDGHSFWPQLIGEKTQPRDWYYCWYAPRGKLQGEFAANQRLKLYRDGRLFDVEKDAQEQTPLEPDQLSPKDRATLELLQQALTKYKNARPLELQQRQPTRADPAEAD